jgi:hypothetical protein
MSPRWDPKDLRPSTAGSAGMVFILRTSYVSLSSRFPGPRAWWPCWQDETTTPVCASEARETMSTCSRVHHVHFPCAHAWTFSSTSRSWKHAGSRINPFVHLDQSTLRKKLLVKFFNLTKFSQFMYININ